MATYDFSNAIPYVPTHVGELINDELGKFLVNCYFSMYCFSSCVIYVQTSWKVSGSLNLIFFK